jgi:hypothetical protein
MGERQQAAGGPRCLPLHASSLDREIQSKPRQDFLDVFAELARLTFGHISTQVWHGSEVQPHKFNAPYCMGVIATVSGLHSAYASNML